MIVALDIWVDPVHGFWRFSSFLCIIISSRMPTNTIDHVVASQGQATTNLQFLRERKPCKNRTGIHEVHVKKIRIRITLSKLEGHIQN